MKASPLFLLAFLAIAVSARAQEPSATATTARILGDIPDGSPPPPSTPAPEFMVPAKDILKTTTHQQGGRTITIRQIKPIDLPPPPETKPAPAAADSVAFQEKLADFRARHQQSTPVSLGATVYRSKDFPPRSLVHFRPIGNGEPIAFWSSADFSLLAGIQSFIDTEGKTHPLFLMCGSVNIDAAAALRAQHGLGYQAPAFPPFPEGKATFQIIGNPPAAQDLVPIQSLHDLYNTEFDRLLAAYHGREQARIQREADLKAHPPQPKDITLNYWRTEKPAPATEGGAR